MEIQELQGRVYFLAGQLEEAKLIYDKFVKEIEKAREEKAKSVTEDSATTVHANG